MGKRADTSEFYGSSVDVARIGDNETAGKQRIRLMLMLKDHQYVTGP